MFLLNFVTSPIHPSFFMDCSSNGPVFFFKRSWVTGSDARLLSSRIFLGCNEVDVAFSSSSKGPRGVKVDHPKVERFEIFVGVGVGAVNFWISSPPQKKRGWKEKHRFPFLATVATCISGWFLGNEGS